MGFTHKRLLISIFILFNIFCQTTIGRETNRLPASHSKWLAAGGLGLTVSPTLVLLNPQIEKAINDHVLGGIMMQAGVGDLALVSMTGTLRYLVLSSKAIKPSVEAGVGLAMGSSSFGSALGVEIHMGMGFDYLISRDFTLGTIIRANFAPPLKTFFLSWPLLIARFYL